MIVPRVAGVTVRCSSATDEDGHGPSRLGRMGPVGRPRWIQRPLASRMTG
jgi:hypothetical protein